MRRLCCMIIMVMLLIPPVGALEITAPEVPDSAADLLEERPESFGEGLLLLLENALPLISPALSESMRFTGSMLIVCLLLSLLSYFPNLSQDLLCLTGTVVLGTMMFQSSKSLIHLGVQTINQISDYGKLLLPVMTAAMGAEGRLTSATALYAATAFFDSLLCSVLTNIMTPMLYIFLCLVICAGAAGEDILVKMVDFLKWLMTGTLKNILYVFTGYIGITGAVSGSTDAAALKATKLTISGVVPVVGGILADASDAVLVSASVVKNAAGIYGMLAIIALWIAPFLQIGTQYLLVKATGGICAMFAPKRLSQVISHFSFALGILVAMTGAICLMLMISMICFLRGVG